MADPFRVLQGQIAMFRVVADVPDEMMPDMASIIGSEIKRTAGAGQDPDGVPWAPKRDGKPFTFYKPSELNVGIIGRSVIVRLTTRVLTLHHLGHAWGYNSDKATAHEGSGHSVRGRSAVEARRVIPTDRMPALMVGKIKARLVQRFETAVANG